MIQINQLKLPVTHNEDDLKAAILKKLKIREEELLSFEIRRRSTDARDKASIYYSYVLLCHVTNEKNLLKRNRNKNITQVNIKKYELKPTGTVNLNFRPVIIGSGPAGLFCAYELAKNGYNPIVIERGKKVEDRMKDIEKYWETGVLDTSSNVQFGEGGAGTFSDGKLNTMVKDNMGRNREVLEIFANHGAPSDILYLAKPHIGTDKLIEVIPNIRGTIESFGGEFIFEKTVTDFEITDGKLAGVKLDDNSIIPCDIAVLAIGHSARDTFKVLKSRNFEMEQKPFAVGFRVEHPQEMINEDQYGKEYESKLDAADYKLIYHSPEGRTVYSFCMCPGGYVVNASSEEGMLAVNGMSNYKRDSTNANSAIIINVDTSDFQSEDVLAGVEFQRNLEKKAFELGKGKIPQQLFGDFESKKSSTAYGSFNSCHKGNATFADLHLVFDEKTNAIFIAAMHDFSHRLCDYDRFDAILSGIETRTSSPVRILRDEEFESNIKGIYPCGEGAGYAGGIMSAAMDGIKVAEMISAKYKSETEGN
ncbi:MAG: NAD(P)/FAD-dependent oxidoreductase [Lachnospiraceae bacterium]|nr:NAD(P)/FAD-dependent oxidoreductase [Lachnospiraceae bacterium]